MKLINLASQVVTQSGVRVIQGESPLSYKMALIGLCHMHPSSNGFRLEKNQLEMLDSIDVKLAKANGELELSAEEIVLLKLVAQYTKTGPQYVAICRFLEGKKDA